MKTTCQLEDSCALCQTDGQESEVEGVNIHLPFLSDLVQLVSMSLFLGALMDLVMWINSNLLLSVCA